MDVGVQPGLHHGANCLPPLVFVGGENFKLSLVVLIVDEFFLNVLVHSFCDEECFDVSHLFTYKVVGVRTPPPE